MDWFAFLLRSKLDSKNKFKFDEHLIGIEPITSAPKADTLPVKLKMLKVN